MVPEEVIVPPVRPVPAVTDVTLPVTPVTQVNPPTQAEQAVRTCPFNPTKSSVGDSGAVAVIREPLAVRFVGEITQAALRAMVPEEVIVPPVKPAPAVTEETLPEVPETHSKPVVQRGFMDRTCPVVPSGSAAGVEAAVPVSKAPLPVTQAQGIARLAISFTRSMAH
jgi:hypothetical protein